MLQVFFDIFCRCLTFLVYGGFLTGVWAGPIIVVVEVDTVVIPVVDVFLPFFEHIMFSISRARKKH